MASMNYFLRNKKKNQTHNDLDIYQYCDRKINISFATTI